MAHVVVMGAGLGGMPAAYELSNTLGAGHQITLINASEHFQFTPSNPWVAVGWRKPEQILVPIRPVVEKKGIRFIAQAVTSLEPQANRISLADGQTLDYDYLVITTGPKLAFDEIPGLGPTVIPIAYAPRLMRRRQDAPMRHSSRTPVPS